MDARRIVVVVEDVEAARTALQWALHNLLRYGDLVTLLHVFPSTRSRSKKNLRRLRLKGFQLALSFKDICNNFLNTKIDIVVTEGDQEGGRIAAMVREIGASELVVGLHDQSFLYKLAMAHNNIANNLNCRVLAIKQPLPLTNAVPPDSSTNMDFSQIEIAKLQVPDVPPPKIRYQILPSPSAIIWRSRKTRRQTMSNLAKLEFTSLDISRNNYLSWALDVELHLTSMDLGETIKEENDQTPQNHAKTLIFLRRHLDEGLKGEYLTVINTSIRNQ